MIVKTSDVANFFDVTERTIQLWAKQGCPKDGHGKWDLKAVLAWWLKHIYQANNDNEAFDKAKQEYWQAKARNEIVRADLAEGSVIPIDEIKKAWAWRINEVSTGLGQIPLRLAPLVVGKTEREIRSILEEQIWKIRDNYSRTGKFTPKTTGETKGKTKAKGKRAKA